MYSKRETRRRDPSSLLLLLGRELGLRERLRLEYDVLRDMDEKEERVK